MPPPPATSASNVILRTSPRHARYLETGDGSTFIPVGLNLCFPRFAKNNDEGAALMETWLRQLADNRGNYFRLWLGHPFFDPEPDAAGRFDEAAAARLTRLLDLARELGLKAKLTLEHFRRLEPGAEAESFPGAARFWRTQYHVSRGGPARSMDDFWQEPACRRLFLNKLDWLAARFADHPAIAAWELWNEVDACQGKGCREWTEFMLPELRRRFPGRLILQSLGSYSGDHVVASYRWLCGLRENDVVQVHRYLDPGAGWPVCRGGMDTMIADAIGALLKQSPERPVLLAEGGAVEANHAGPSKLYETDREGVILHDVLFAAFFAGSAGCGQCWHWDFYVARHALWWHFARFANAIAGFDPVRERATPLAWETPDVRAHSLLGESESIIWIRDARSGWETELAGGLPAPERTGLVLPLPAGLEAPREIEVYDPWSDRRSTLASDAGAVALPAFRRSLVLRLKR